MDGWEIDLHVAETAEDPLDIRITGTVKPMDQVVIEPPIEPPVDPPVEPPVDPPVDPGPGVPPAIHPPGDDFREILEMPGGPNPVVVKAGEYKAGSGRFPHDKRLVVVAEAPGEVMLNLEPADLTLEVGSSNIALCGIEHKNGTLLSNADEFTLFHHRGTFPIEKWHEMYLVSLGGTEAGKSDQQKKDAIQRMTHPLCKGVWIGQDTGGRQIKNNRILGTDIHDCGDDGVFFDKCDGAYIQGTRIWNIDEKGYDPGVNPWGATTDLFHNDAVQIPGSVSEFLLSDSYSQSILQLGGDNGNLRGALYRLWVAGCGSAGGVIISQNNLVTLLTLQDVVGFSNGMSYPHDDGWNTFTTQFCDGRQIIGWGPNPVTTANGGAVSRGRFAIPNRMVLQDLGGNSDGPIPAQFAKADWNPAYLRNKLDPLNDPANPGLMWRQQNPFESWRAFLPSS